MFTVRGVSIVLLLILAYANFNIKKIPIRKESDLDHLCRMSNVELDYFQFNRLKVALRASLILPFLMFVKVSWSMQLPFIVLVVLVYRWPYMNLVKRFNGSIQHLRYEFPIWLRQLQILLQSNTVAVSMEISIPMAPLMIRAQLHQLIHQIRQAPQQIDTYTDFLSGYRLMEVTRAMKLLYRYNAVGQADSVRQLNRMITTTGKWLRQQRIQDQESQSVLLQWWGILPLLSVTVVFLVMMMVTITSFMERG
ncbi:MAG: hypothetical protein Q8S15_10120 [Erysipelotrichaceae bacterium]|nr:hypothetical protein [Erysipelotrichaceae bacterium]